MSRKRAPRTLLRGRHRSDWAGEGVDRVEADTLVLLAPQHRQGARSTAESVAARWGAVALKVNQLHHANSGVEWKTLANHKSNAKRALAWFRGEQGLPLPRHTAET